MPYKNKLAMFDLDGTLFCTKDVNYYAYKKALSKFEITIDYNYYCRNCNGKKYTQFLPDICGFNDDRIKKIHDFKKEFYSNYLCEAKINNHLFSIIDDIKDNYYIALVTTASRKNTIELLKFFNKVEVFDLILTQDEIVNPKPSPEGFITAQKFFNVSEENSIIFEDSEVGIKAAELATKNVFVIKGFN